MFFSASVMKYGDRYPRSTRIPSTRSPVRSAGLSNDLSPEVFLMVRQLELFLAIVTPSLQMMGRLRGNGPPVDSQHDPAAGIG